MSQATKRKIVTQECVRDDVTLAAGQDIVRVLRGMGNNLHEVVNSSGEATLCSMPPKFRKNVWIKRGDYLIVEPISEGKKVTCEMIHILYDDHIRDLKRDNLWPSGFEEEEEDNVLSFQHANHTDNEKGDFVNYRNNRRESCSDSDSSLSSIEGNMNIRNRPVIYITEDSSDSDSDT